MMTVIEQRTCIKFCFHKNISATKAFEILQNAFKDNCLSKTIVFDWCRMFKDSRESVVDDPPSGRPSTSINDRDIDKIRELMLVDRRFKKRC